MVGSLDSLLDTINYGEYHCNQLVVGYLTTMSAEPLASTSPYTTEANDYGQPLHSGHYWPTIGHQTQSYDSSFSTLYDSFASTMGSEAANMAQTLSSGENPFTLKLLENEY